MRNAFIPPALRAMRAAYGLPLSNVQTSRPALAMSCGGPPKGVSIRTTAPAPGEEDTSMSAVHRKITAALNPSHLEVIPTYGDPNGSHVTIKVVSDQFQGVSPVKRHQMVYQAIWEELSGPIHAVDKLVTNTPDEVSH
ncbi:Protein BOLA4, chloroplastic/mitochondrial [Gracilariopsis chorda]|uniref:Protein BOLA4, chloroplastic/mitochondrial n=1 Tax=Gracilariopsis chorda TaxID=448386 RepID=A0A2V3IR60_9FLOR|nr:Protein BOLA4, chloroplastic/mitochondrial [Gracilariopsis chorda]|eukprot:PXF44583.1 Protein BOLA4, chloroplastic/mitochondrial [Gracilariopsis chorda]